MRFLVDESAGKVLSTLLEESGHDVLFVGEVMPGADDEAVLAAAEKGRRILVTDDKDFGEPIFRLGRPSSGVMLLRYSSTDSRKRLKGLLQAMERTDIVGSFVTIKEDRIKIRRLK